MSDPSRDDKRRSQDSSVESPPTADEEKALTALRQQADVLWPAAVRRWSAFTLLRPPQDKRAPFIARIDLKSRAVEYDGLQIVRHGLQAALPAILAHEVGHHVRYPGELSTWLRLLLLEGDIAPTGAPSVLNLFADLCINTELADQDRHLAAALTSIYHAFRSPTTWTDWPAFAFSLLIYAREWRIDPDKILQNADRFFAHYPNAKRDADRARGALFPPRRGSVQGSQFETFLCFLDIARPYLEVGSPSTHTPPPGLNCLPEAADDEDWGRALEPGGEERRALERAAKEGWCEPERADRALDDNAPFRRARRIRNAKGLPQNDDDIHCFGGDDNEDGAAATGVLGVLSAWYLRQAAKASIALPQSVVAGDNPIPTTLAEWEPGLPLGAIDWVESTRHRGAMAAGAPLLREVHQDPDIDGEPERGPLLELFVDVSASMPDPSREKNPMTLGALILARSAIQDRGAVKVCLYSSSPIAMDTFVRTESAVSDFLMRYIGSGTRFPTAVLDDWVSTQRAETVRVILSDSDFLYEVEESNAQSQAQSSTAGLAARLATASKQSSPLIVLLHDVDPSEAEQLESIFDARVMNVGPIDGYIEVAAKIGRSLFSRARRHVAARERSR